MAVDWSIIQRLRAMAGQPHITYPTASLSFPTIEQLSIRQAKDAPTKPYLGSHPDIASAKLTVQEIINSDQQYSDVYRKWETLPGQEIGTPYYDPETGAPGMVYVQRLAQPAALDPLDSYRGGAFYTIDSSFSNVTSAAVTRTTKSLSLPANWMIRGSRQYPCPALFTFIGGWAIPNPPFRTQGPYAGINFDKTARRTAVMTEEVRSYTIGPDPTPMPVVWTVITPGDASRFLPIDGNTIHNAIYLVETDLGTGDTQVVEDLDASTPSTYTIGQDMVISATERRMEGNMWERIVITAFEPT